MRLQAVAARVAAWHNRHPLARRVTPAQVQSVGYVALPFAAIGVAPAAEPGAEAAAVAPPPAAEAKAPEEGKSLREKAQARARVEQKLAAVPTLPLSAVVAVPRGAVADLQSAFSEDFIPPLKPRQVAHFAANHGFELQRLPVDGPVRQVLADALPPGTGPATLFLHTAAIEVAGRRSRVLVGVGEKTAPLLGHRIWSPVRGAVAGALLMVLVAAGVSGVRLLNPTKPVPGPATAASAPTSPASAAATAAIAAPVAPPVKAASTADVAHASTPHQAASNAAPTSAPTATPTAAPAHDDTHASQPAARHAVGAASTPAAAGLPVDVEPRLGRIELPPIVPRLSDAARAAARQERPPGARVAPSEAAKPAAPHSDGHAGQSPAHAGAASSPAAAASAAAPVAAQRPRGEAIFAVSTRALRTKAEAEQVQVAMQALLQAAGAGAVRVEVLPQGDDWRVAGWPFKSQAQAEQARVLLASRGMRVQVLDF